uniref:hypothetical protein n=1 Tax=Proteus terrae TaxID=1574161 RepID=UPI00301D8A4F
RRGNAARLIAKKSTPGSGHVGGENIRQNTKSVGPSQDHTIPCRITLTSIFRRTIKGFSSLVYSGVVNICSSQISALL